MTRMRVPVIVGEYWNGYFLSIVLRKQTKESAQRAVENFRSWVRGRIWFREESR
jgi:hypothetical protein